MFSCEFYGTSKNTFFTEHLQATASFSLHYDRVFDKIYYRVLIKACNLWFEHNIHNKAEKKTILSYQYLILPMPLSTQCQILMQAP